MKISFSYKSAQDINLENQIKLWHQEVMSLLEKKAYFSSLESMPLMVELSTAMRSTAGRARGTRLIMLNYRLLAGNMQEMRDTYVHELAHIVCNIVYKKACGHGPKWKAMMKSMGAKPIRTHKLDVSSLKRKVKSRAIYEYTCSPSCGKTFKLSIVRHKKIAVGTKYHCKACKGVISFKGMVS